MMSVQEQGSSKGPFIPTELRPEVGLDLEASPPLEPGASKEEILRRASEVLGETEGMPLGLAEGTPSSEMWKTIVTRSPDVHWTVLDGEAVLLNLENGVYYSLNRVGTAVWELFTGDRALEEILSTVCERFEVTKEVARGDLIALVTRLRQEGLITERR